jgi:hypothetical protein
MPDQSSEFADEGTLAHELGEWLIRAKLGEFDGKASAVGLFYYPMTQNKYYSEAMEEYCDQYATYVIEKYNEVKQHTPDAHIQLETKLDLRKWIPESWGTGDVIIAGTGVLWVIDLKYGKGVEVSVVDNPQLKYTALVRWISLTNCTELTT